MWAQKCLRLGIVDDFDPRRPSYLVYISNSMSVERNLEPTVAWLKTRMRLDQKVRVVVVVAAVLFFAAALVLVSGRDVIQLLLHKCLASKCYSTTRQASVTACLPITPCPSASTGLNKWPQHAVAQNVFRGYNQACVICPSFAVFSGLARIPFFGCEKDKCSEEPSRMPCRTIAGILHHLFQRHPPPLKSVLPLYQRLPLVCTVDTSKYDFSLSCFRQRVVTTRPTAALCACVPQGVAAMVRGLPHVLGLNPEKNIEPKLAWLKENLDLDEERVLRLVKVCSWLLHALSVQFFYVALRMLPKACRRAFKLNHMC